MIVIKLLKSVENKVKRDIANRKQLITIYD